MEETMQFPEQVVAKKRPAFLKVLCIITFIVSGLLFLFSLFLIVYAIVYEGYFMKSAILMVLYAASIFGAIMMWKLKKIGFYIYVAAQVVIVVLIFNLTNSAQGFIFSLCYLFFALLFVVMYFLNFKHME